MAWKIIGEQSDVKVHANFDLCTRNVKMAGKTIGLQSDDHMSCLEFPAELFIAFLTM